MDENRFGQQIELTVSPEPDPDLRSGEKRIYGIEVKGEVAISPDQLYHAAKSAKSKILISLGVLFVVWMVCAFIILSAIKKPSAYPAWLSSRILDFFRIRNPEEPERDPYIERRL